MTARAGEDPVVRKVLAKRYRVAARAGEGALSVVYKAHDELLDRTVALKILKDGVGFDGTAVERFFAEARAAAKIVDPHVVALYDVIDTEAGHAIVMEYVDGPTLEQRIRVAGRVPEVSAVRYAMQIAQALQAAHERGMLHRDVKPGNVLIGPGDDVKVVDFGLVKALDGTAALTQTGTFVGSVQYVSPEQARGEPLSAASDLYSLGVVMFQMLTGSLPFEGESPIAVALAHVASPVPSRRELELSASPALAAIVERLLQKDPSKRFASAREVVAALQRVPVAPTPEDAPAPAPTMVSRTIASRPPEARLPQARRAIAAGAGGLFAIALIGTLTQQATATVADVRGGTVAAARATLTKAGLRVRSIDRASEVVGEGRVIAQSPAPKSVLRAGETVEIVRSSGLPFVTVPDVMGLRVDVAASRLRGTKLRPQLGTRASNATPATIVEEIPRGGSRVREGSLLIVIMATQPNAAPPTGGGGD